VPHRSHTVTAECEDHEITEQTTAQEEGEILRKHDMYRKMLEKWRHLQQTERKATEREHPLRTIVFCANTTECAKWAEEALRMDIRCRIVTYKQGDEAVLSATQQLLKGEIDQIITVNKLAEGFDCRPINCVMIARATHSPVKVAQPVGRGLRAQKKHEDELYGPKKVCHLIEGKFILSPKRTVKPNQSPKEAMLDRWREIEESEENDREFLRNGTSTMTFNEYLQTKEGISGEAEGSEVKEARLLKFDENGIAEIKLKGKLQGIVLLEAYIQNFPFIEAEKLLDRNPEMIRLNENVCRFGKIPVKLAYLKKDIDELVDEYYSTHIHLSEEGIGIFPSVKETLRGRKLTGPEVVSPDFVRRSLAGYLHDGMDEDQLIKFLSVHGVQWISLKEGMIAYDSAGRSIKRIFFKQDIDTLKEELQQPKKEEEEIKADFRVPEGKDSDIEFTMTFEDGTHIDFLSFGRIPVLKEMVQKIKEQANKLKNDKATLRFMSKKLTDYLYKLLEHGMTSGKGARMGQKVVEEIVANPLDELLEEIQDWLAQ